MQKAGTSIVQALAQLGLPPTECFNFHLRGKCGNPRCSNQHTDSAVVNPTSAAALLVTLIDAKAQL